MKSFIEKANELGMTVVEIDNRFYILSGDWRPAEEMINKHTLIGRDVTEMKDGFGNAYFGVNEDQSFLTALDKYPITRREFHKDYKWILYAGR
jgi:hypothetical protein